ncbi:MAG TPA: DUF2254 domain-containing protein [Anaerolineales bacterium]|nr:DUF2254 domain-containing protein [Anaerolineales bacterium]
MNTNFLKSWEVIRSSYWFIPTVLTGGAIALSFWTLNLDRAVRSGQLQLLDWVYTGGPEGVRTLLSVLAGSMITMASLSYSITIVALTLASSQFGPRLLANFMRDTGNQVVLGTFVATFIYCLLVLRTVRSVEESVFVPHISVTVAFFLGVISLGLLIYFIHHASASIHVENVVASVERELSRAIERLFPEKKGAYLFEYTLRQEDDVPEAFGEEARPVASRTSGYLQTIDDDRLMKLAVKGDLLLRLEHRPGEFIAAGKTLVQAWPADRLEEEIEEKIANAFQLGAQRLRLQDVEFAIDQLVEIALRALSPGINDPFTAMACIDRLGAALARLAERRIPSAYRYDAEDKLRLITDPVTFEGIVEAAFNQIRQHARANAAVTIRLLETLAVIGARTRTESEREALRRQAIMIQRGSREALPEEYDLEAVEERYRTVQTVLDGS